MLTTNEIVHSALEETWYAKAGARPEDGLELAKRLERAVIQSVPGRSLATRLRRCRPHRRCGSSACPQCGKAGQALLASVTAKFAKGQAKNLEVAFATIIPCSSAVRKGALHDLDVANFKRRLRDGLAKSSALCAVGAVDLTLNEHCDDVFDPYWSPHAHVIVATDDIDGFANGLRAAFPRSANAPRPVVVKAWDGDPRVFAYVFKADFVRRISIAQTERFDPSTGKTRLCRGTTYARLRVCEGIELAFFLDKIGLGGRLLFRNTRLYRTDKAVRLQLTTGQRAPDALS